MKKIAIITVAVLLSGCAMLKSPEQKAAEAEAQYRGLQNLARLQEQIDHDTCEKRFGAKRGSQAYVQCRMSQDQQRTYERQAELNRQNQIDAMRELTRPRFQPMPYIR